MYALAREVVFFHRRDKQMFLRISKQPNWNSEMLKVTSIVLPLRATPVPVIDSGSSGEEGLYLPSEHRS
jgi:hypothetical protein